MKKSYYFTILLLTTFCSFAQNLDPIFGPNGGIVTLSLSSQLSSDGARGGVLQPDGKILVYGSTNVVRLTTSNVLDTSFNFCGFRSVGGTIYSIAIQADGKIVVAMKNTFIRLNSNGSWDTSFVTPNLSSYQSLTINAIGLNSSGKVVFVGNFSNGIDNDIIVGSLNSDGSLNTSFSNDGIATLNLPGSDESAINLKIESVTNKILVCGSKAISTTDSDFLVTRFTSAGALDVFGTNGILTLNYETNDVFTAMDFQSDGKLIAVGTSMDATNVEYLIARRINGDGSLDNLLIYNQSGFRKFNNSSSYNLRKPEVKVIASEKIVISGTRYSGSANAPAIVQLNPNGTYDTNFVGFSTFTSSIGTSDAYNGSSSSTSFLLQRMDGSFIVGGTSYDGSNWNIRLVNFSATGPYLSEANINLTTGIDDVRSIVEQTNGKTVALVASKQGLNYAALLVRYSSNGNIDTLFGADNSGIVDTGLINPYRLAKQTDGKILVSTVTGIIKRFTADGFLDTGFANSGVLDFSSTATNGLVDFINNIATTSDGKIYIAFDYYLNDLYNIGLYRLNNDGSIDTTFGVDGIASTRFDTLNANEKEFPQHFFIQSDAKIIVACLINYNGTSMGGIVRFSASGTVDTTFGNNGKVTTQTGNFYNPTIIGTQNNKFLIDVKISNTRLLTQFNSDGSYDTSFGSNGSVSIPYSSGDMILQPDGKILCSANGSINRFNTNGSLDTSFGTNGVLSTSVYTNFNHIINKLLWTKNGKLLEAGYDFTGSKYIGTLIRYTDLTLGTLDFAVDENKMLVYPNPIHSEATFNYTLREDSIISITITDLLGRVVKTIRSKEMQSSGDHNQNVSIGELASGNYLLLFSSPKGIKSVQLIKGN
jgi:uncharacterized delta-60 repeat protein